ncbi:MAG: hypothetical protein M3349_00550 [Actinomycetota bacterium]|nr:hypothetical protein [Actinomycetota bacterium]
MSTLQHTAQLIRAYLRRHQADLAPLATITATLGITAATARAAVRYYADLGITGPPQQPHLWWLPTPPLHAGFHPVAHNGHLVLRLPAPNPHDPALHLAAHHLATPPQEQPPTPELANLRLGPLAQTITRLCLMTPNHCDMFGLIAHTWRTSTVVFTTGRLHVRQTQHPPQDLELITWLDDYNTLQLINLYPTGLHHLAAPRWPVPRPQPDGTPWRHRGL